VLLLAMVAVCFLAAFLKWLRAVAHEAPLAPYATNAAAFHHHR
jgi:hypothetical protein